MTFYMPRRLIMILQTNDNDNDKARNAKVVTIRIHKDSD